MNISDRTFNLSPETSSFYKIWSKNTPHFYDELLITKTEWPSQTIEFFDFATYDESTSTTTQNFLTASQTSGNEQEYLCIKKIVVPDLLTAERVKEYKEEGEQFEYTINSKKPETKTKNNKNLFNNYSGGIFDDITIPVYLEVNRARICPSAQNVIACRGDIPEIHVYDYTKHKSISNLSKNTKQKPDLVLTGNSSGGFGLSWSTLKKGHLATSSDDGTVCVYDIKKSSNGNTLSPLIKIEQQHSTNDVCFSHQDENLLAYVSDDKQLTTLDIRSSYEQNSFKASDFQIFSVDLPRTSSTKIVIGDSSGFIKIFDIRRLESSYPISVLQYHKKAITSIKFNPKDDRILLSSGEDGRVCIWNTENKFENHNCQNPNTYGDNTTNRSACECFEEGIPELVFVHGGHIEAVNDVCWNLVEDYEIGSVAHDSSINIFKPSIFS